MFELFIYSIVDYLIDNGLQCTQPHKLTEVHWPWHTWIINPLIGPHPNQTKNIMGPAWTYYKVCPIPPSTLGRIVCEQNCLWVECWHTSPGYWALEYANPTLFSTILERFQQDLANYKERTF